nr:MAG TPA: hypothetical protein [Caudoviricetes sp.]
MIENSWSSWKSPTTIPVDLPGSTAITRCIIPFSSLSLS